MTTKSKGLRCEIPRCETEDSNSFLPTQVGRWNADLFVVCGVVSPGARGYCPIDSLPSSNPIPLLRHRLGYSEDLGICLGFDRLRTSCLGGRDTRRGCGYSACLLADRQPEASIGSWGFGMLRGASNNRVHIVYWYCISRIRVLDTMTESALDSCSLSCHRDDITFVIAVTSRSGMAVAIVNDLRD